MRVLLAFLLEDLTIFKQLGKANGKIKIIDIAVLNNDIVYHRKFERLLYVLQQKQYENFYFKLICQLHGG